MKINKSFKEYKINHSKNIHQILFRSRSCKNYYKVENLFKFLLAEKIVLFLNPLKKELLKVAIQ